jgi:hypothetical protein
MRANHALAHSLFKFVLGSIVAASILKKGSND